MSYPSGIAKENKQPWGDGSEPQEAKAEVFFSSPALIANERIIRIYSVLSSRRQQFITALVWTVVTALFCAWVVSFTYAVFISDRPVPHLYDYSPRITIAVVNVASHVAAQLVGWMMSAIFDMLSWNVISGHSGASLRTFLAANQGTGLWTVTTFLFTLGVHQLWCILRFFFLGAGWVVGILLLSSISYKDVYYRNQTIPIVGGIAPLRSTVAALTDASYGGQQPSLEGASINTMLLSSTNSILTDPKLVVSVGPVTPGCKGVDCRSLFFPGGLELLLKQDGSTLFDGTQPDDPVLIVNDAPGYQIDFSSTSFTFDHDVDCQVYGLPVSALYACVASRNNTLFSGFASCPFDLIQSAHCQSDTSWTQPLQGTVSMNVYKRMSTVAYDSSNFSILSVESLGPPEVAVDEDSVADLRTLFTIMYPQLSTIIDDIADAVIGFDTGQMWTDLAYLASVYCLQAEVTAAELLYKGIHPDWQNGQRDILEGFLAIPVQFSNLLLQELNKTALLTDMDTTATWAHVSFRVRSETWPIAVFALLASCLVLWASLCLAYAYWASAHRNIVEEEPSQTIQDAFRRGNPFEPSSSGIWQSLSGWWRRVRGKYTPAPQSTTARGPTYVVARTVGDGMYIAVDRDKDHEKDTN